MGEGRRILRRFGNRLRQIHISELDAAGHHHRLSIATVLATRRILSLLSSDAPAIIESQIAPDRIASEVAIVESALSAVPDSSEWERPDWGASAS